MVNKIVLWKTLIFIHFFKIDRDTEMHAAVALQKEVRRCEALHEQALGENYVPLGMFLIHNFT